MNTKIHKYYNDLAAEYDNDRFNNTYGTFIHTQEKKILSKWLNPQRTILDIACGTGRFLEFATHGIDISENMLLEASKKYPEKILENQDIENLNYVNGAFDDAFSFHLMMHLEKEQLPNILKSVSSIVKTNGLFIFDIPSKKRRKLFNYKSKGWHGSNALTVKSLQSMLENDWTLETYYGIAFFPIHRIPKRLRKYFIYIDPLLCKSWIKEWSSHLIIILKKNS